PVILSDTGHTLVIHGNGATLERSTAGGTPPFRIFQIGAGADVTISALTIRNGIANFSVGGGIFNNHATLTVSNSTISGNSATVNGGGIFNDGFTGSATLTIGDTILNAGGGANISNSFGIVISLGYNLSSDNGSGFLTATGDQINTAPMLGPLQDNGGPTFTHELLSGSPAIDAGDPGFDPYFFSPPLLEDQRGDGFPRAVKDRIDIGAFEV